MKFDDRFRSLPGVLLLLSLLFLFGQVKAHAITWVETNDTLACEAEGKILWRFSYATNQGKPFFHPLSVLGDEPLTQLKPKDHPWHYGLWFSWKYINGVNYWEEDKKSGKAHGLTRWARPEILKRDNGMATIRMNLEYVSPSNAVVMTEQREIKISVPDKYGEVLMDWNATFTAGSQPLLLDRTHMLGETNGAVNGGYAGLSLRAPSAPAQCEFVTIDGPVEKFESDRARPNSLAAACNVIRGDLKSGVAIFSCAANAGGPAPWYMINSSTLRWFSPALLAPHPRKVKPNESFTWKFRISTKAGGWLAKDLEVADKKYEASLGSIQQR